jgi:hypothetical protein
MPATAFHTEALQSFLAAFDGAGGSALDFLGVVAGIAYVLLTELASHRSLHSLRG